MSEHNQTEDRFVALVRDPSSIFAYWDLGEEVRQSLVTRLGEATLRDSHWVLRLTDLGTAAVSNITIEPEARNWYVTVLPGHSYEVEMGVVDPDGGFHRLFQSGPLRMPPLSYSHLYDKQWMILEEDYLRLLALGWAGFGGSSAGMPNGLDEAVEPMSVVRELPEGADGEEPGGSAA